MKYRLFLVGLCFIFFSQLTIAVEDQEQNVSSKKQVQLSALTYLDNMKQAYKTLNYELLYINTAQNQIEPKQVIHGVLDGKEITYFRYLNGAIRESFQFDGKISYYEQGNQAYSLESNRDQSVFANLANFNFESGNKNYEYIILGKGRIAGKKVIAIRMISKDDYRYSYIIWLDLESYLPLRLDTINKSNIILEQTMVVSLNITETINPWIKHLTEQKKPEIQHLPIASTHDAPKWKINWQPEGFKIVKDDQHKLMMHDTDSVSYFMLSDGLVSISIYISLKNTDTVGVKNVIQRGSTLLYTEYQENIEVNIIGDIPLNTAEKLASSIIRIE